MKSFSLYLIFAIYCLLSLTHANNCKSIGQDGSTCLSCYQGYTLVSGNCICMISNCDWCDADSSNNTFCGQCSSYFGVKSTDSVTCYSCYIDGCWNCTLDAQSSPICQNCSYGYVLQNNKCVQCSDVIPGCRTCNQTNGIVQCLSCMIELDYYSNGTSCVACGSDAPSKNCQMCSNSGYYDSTSSDNHGYCFTCQEGYISVNNKSQFCAPCNISNCKSCSPYSYSQTCYKCNDGYGWDYGSTSCISSNITNCSSGSSGTCSYCNDGYFKNGTGYCVKCSDYGTTVSNCLQPSCSYSSSSSTSNSSTSNSSTSNSSSSGVVSQTCQECNASYYSDSSQKSCSKCSDLLSNCISCYYSYSHLIESGYYLCSKCEPGYYLQFLTDNITYVCTQNCSSKHVFDDTLKMCIPCSQIFGNGCSSCNRTQCLSCESKFYSLVLPEANLSCSNCTNQIETLVTVSNVQFCSRKGNALIINFTNTNNSKSARLNASCGIASSKVFFAYGPVDNLQSITLDMVKAKVGLSNNTNVPSTANTNWIGYGVRKQNYSQNANITLIPPLRLAGEKYRLTIWCQSAVNASDISSASQDWTQPSNGGIKTKISFDTTVQLTSQQKKTLGIAVRKTLKINTDIYTDEGDLVPLTMQTLTGSRILSNDRLLTGSYSTSFVILPDYTSTSDFTSTLINQTVSSSSFAQNVTSVWTSLNSSNTIQIANVTTASVTTSSPTPILSGVTLAQNGNSFTVSFTITNTNGTFYVGMDNATYGLQYANLSTAGITYPSWAQLVQGKNANSVSLARFASLAVPANQSSTMTLQGLDSNKTYLVYYGAANNDIPPAYTNLYANVTNTIGSSGDNGSTSALRVMAWSCFLVLLILVW